MNIIDTHNDFITYLNSAEQETYLNACKAYGVKEICASFFTTEKKNVVLPVLEPHPIKLNLHIEDLHFVTPKNMPALLDAKPFSCGLTWNHKNALAGGCESCGGITTWGREVIKTLEENGIVIDTAHLNRQSFLEFICLTTKPIYNSHSCFYSCHEHRRNLQNYELTEIIKSGGFVGLTFFTQFLNGSSHATLADVVKHINYFINQFGPNHIGLGTDFWGCSTLPQGLQFYNDFSNLKTALINQGVTKEDAENIFYKNFIAFKERLEKGLLF